MSVMAKIHVKFCQHRVNAGENMSTYVEYVRKYVNICWIREKLCQHRENTC